MSNGSLLMGWRRQWNRSLLRFLRRRVRAAVDIEDLAQETYLRLLRARDLHDVRNPHAYLLRVASHVALEWRERQPPPDAMVEVEEDTLIDEHPPELELDAHLSQTRFDQTLARMSPVMQAAMLLRLRDSRSHKDIAKELQITVRQVERHIERGYDLLRAAMENRLVTRE